jgi:acyl dehydratase
MPDRFFEDYRVGQRWVTRGRTITEADVVNFAGLSGDFFPLHVDDDYARRTRFGRRVAHGFLVLSVASGLLPANPEAVEALYGLDRVRFVAPVFIGDTLRVELEVTELRPRPDGSGVVTFQQTVRKHTGEVAVTSLYHLLVRRRPAEG